MMLMILIRKQLQECKHPICDHCKIAAKERKDITLLKLQKLTKKQGEIAQMVEHLVYIFSSGLEFKSWLGSVFL